MVVPAVCKGLDWIVVACNNNNAAQAAACRMLLAKLNQEFTKFKCDLEHQENSHHCVLLVGEKCLCRTPLDDKKIIIGHLCDNKNLIGIAKAREVII